MKTLLSFFLIIFACVSAFSQTESDSQWTHDRHHEIGLDVTAFIKQFTTFNGSGFILDPVYQFTYRYKTKFGNARFGIGGAYQESEYQDLWISDSTIRTRMENMVSARIGWEFKTEISRRWQAFYGIDFRPNFYYNRNDSYNYDFEYIIGREEKTTIMGVAPLLGFRFRLTERLSLTTEASFALNFQNSAERIYYMPRYDFVGPKGDYKSEDLKSVYGRFIAPTFITINFDL